MEDGNSAAELQRDQAEQKRNALLPVGEEREQWIYEHTTKMMENPDYWAMEIATDVCAIWIKTIMGYVATCNWADLMQMLDAQMRYALHTRAEEEFNDHDWEADAIAAKEDYEN